MATFDTRITTGGASTDLVYDGNKLIDELNMTTMVGLRWYINGDGTDEPLIWYVGGYPNCSAACVPNYILQDRQGSVIGTSDAAGTVTPYTYGPYGEPQSWAGSRFRYTGQIALPEAQLYYYKARVYDPGMGRFLQTDPIGYGDGMNIYAYVHGDPVNGTDPSGLDIQEIVVPGQYPNDVTGPIYVSDPMS